MHIKASSACFGGDTMVIKKGSKVTLDYEGTLDDGTVFDSSQAHGAPLAFEAGSGQMIKGFDDAVMGMKQGEEKTFTLNPEDAYGQPNADLVKTIPRDQLPPGEPKVDMMLGVTLPNGMQLPARIVEVTADEVKIDLNHPLSGKKLTFKIKIVSVEEPK